MRISDWSSDVCSSDLQLSRRDLHAERRIVLAPWPPVVALQLSGVAVVPVAGRELRDVVAQSHQRFRSEEHTSELQSLMRISYAVFCLNKNKQKNTKYTS